MGQASHKTYFLFNLFHELISGTQRRRRRGRQSEPVPSFWQLVPKSHSTLLLTAEIRSEIILTHHTIAQLIATNNNRRRWIRR